MHVPTIVCPVDYSDCSKRALRFAGALAEHFAARVAVVHVFEPEVAATAAAHQFALTGAAGQEELQSFVEDYLSAELRHGTRLERLLLVGIPGSEILKVAASRTADLIVMGTHGFSGARRAFFGSTLHAVLRLARVPVLAVPVTDHREVQIQARLIASGPVIAPMDFSPESYGAARAAAGLAQALELPLQLLHVVPASTTQPPRQSAPCREEGVAVPNPAILMSEIALSFSRQIEVETRVVHGNPPEEIARLAREKGAGVIVMSLGSSLMHPREPGSVAYQVLCLSPVPVLALPETPAGQVYVEHLHSTGRASAAEAADGVAH